MKYKIGQKLYCYTSNKYNIKDIKNIEDFIRTYEIIKIYGCKTKTCFVEEKIIAKCISGNKYSNEIIYIKDINDNKICCGFFTTKLKAINSYNRRYYERNRQRN